MQKLRGLKNLSVYIPSEEFDYMFFKVLMSNLIPMELSGFPGEVLKWALSLFI